MQEGVLGLVADGASAVGGASDNIPALANAGAKLWSFQNNSVEKAFVGADGSMEVTTVGASFILKSADGTRWKLVVADTTGVLSTTLA
jgi:hypothetical protein